MFRNIAKCNSKKYFNILCINMICTLTTIFHNLIIMINFHDTNRKYMHKLS